MRSGLGDCRTEQESSVHHRDPFTLFPNMGFDEDWMGLSGNGNGNGIGSSKNGMGCQIGHSLHCKHKSCFVVNMLHLQVEFQSTICL
jgi:hypothetical protein